THVAGLASGLGLKAIIGKRDFDKVSFRPKIMGITYLGDAESGPAVEPEYTPISSTSEVKQVLALNDFLTDYLKWQKNKFKLAMDYSAKKAQVVNCSFGISPKGANSMIDSWWEKQFPNQESSSTYLKSEKEKLTHRLRSGLLKLTKEVVDLHPNTLFVFSAGNTKLNTEAETHYPSGVRCDHCLSVGATLGTEELASFSNFAATRVSLFAPGVAMQSIVPFNRRMPVNGTSQAAPQVAYAAALILQTVKSMGKKISGSLVKKILEESVDKKSWLTGKGKAAGIVNPVRALYLTNKLRYLSFSKAKSLAYKNIQDLTYYPGPRPVQKSLLESLEVDELFSR
ncbi:MAG: S8 family serine peptidase, partial [Halobacteriovoraceae bacterium]|nr:S8 family serine peptidase [Halobacteriovoraceae bacterium]